MDSIHQVTIELEESLYQDLKEFKAHMSIDDDSKAVLRMVVMFLRGICEKPTEEQ